MVDLGFVSEVRYHLVLGLLLLPAAVIMSLTAVSRRFCPFGDLVWNSSHSAEFSQFGTAARAGDSGAG